MIVIAGPTAVGKTDLSIELAHHFNGEVINGDSLQIYRGLDIGTGKIHPEEMQDVPHHLIDILEADERYDVSRFVQAATALIVDIYHRGKLPIIVGGTGLYLEALMYQLELGQDGSDSEVRKTYQEKLERVGNQALWTELDAKDPEAAASIPYQNTRRVIRALEYIAVSGQPFSKQNGHQEQVSRFKELILVLDRPRELLYERINQRVLMMVNDGLEAEVMDVYQKQGDADWQSSKGIGYKEWFPYFKNEISRDQVISDIQQNSRRYAKRQLTWFRNRFKQKEWISIDASEDWKTQIFDLIQQHINR